jgi:hypothetical protein
MKVNDCSMYYCLASDGLLWVLGNHGDIEAADDTAKSMGLEAVWILDEKTAESWRNTLNKGNEWGGNTDEIENI